MRILELIAKLEANESLTNEDIRKASQLQALDIVVQGRKFVEDLFDEDREQAKELLNERN